MIPRCAMMVNSASNSRWWPFWVRLISLVRNEKPCTVHQTMLQKILFVKQTCKMYRISLTCSNLSSCFFWAHSRVMWWTDCKCVRTIAFRANKKGLFSPSVICCATDFKSDLKFNLEGHACNLNFRWIEIGGIGRSFEQCKIPLWFFELDWRYFNVRFSLRYSKLYPSYYRGKFTTKHVIWNANPPDSILNAPTLCQSLKILNLNEKQ